MYKKPSTTLKDLQSLLGLLNFCTKVVVPGRTFLRRLIDLTKGITRPSHHIRLNKEARADLACWRQLPREARLYSQLVLSTPPTPPTPTPPPPTTTTTPTGPERHVNLPSL